MTTRLICYVEILPEENTEVWPEWQLEQSLESLRTHTPDLPVELLWFGTQMSPSLQILIDRYGVTSTPLGDLKSYLEQRLPGTALHWLPEMVKWIALTELANHDVDQLLCLSRRTAVLEDPQLLFERYSDRDVYARETPFSPEDQVRHQPGYINSDLLKKLAHPHAPLPIFNLDVLLLNHQTWKLWTQISDQFLVLLWKFTLWLTFKVRDYTQDSIHIHKNKDYYLQAMPSESAVPLPSIDPNLRAAIALSLVMGTIPDLTYGFFNRHEVFVDSEFMDLTWEGSSLIIGSYGPFGEQFGEWILNGATPISTPLSSAGISFRTHRYATIPGLITDPLLSVAFTYCLHQFRNGRLSQKDPLVPKAPHAYADPFTESLLEIVRPQIEAATGLSLYPTYSFFRVYRRGDELRRHSDRPSSELNVSLMVGSDNNQVLWPLHLETSEGPVGIELHPGDALVYRGADLMHWRHPFTGNLQIQIILAYVDSMGPFRDWKYDRRSRLGSLT